METKIFKLIGIGTNVQYGKRGPRIRDDGAGVLQARNAADTLLNRFQVATPTADDDAATKAYVDGVASGLDVKASVRAKTSASGAETNTIDTWTSSGSGVGKTLTSPDNLTANNDFDGVTLLINERVLVTFAGGADTTPDLDNGIYEITQLATGAAPAILTRATDADENPEPITGTDELSAGAFTFVTEGTEHADTGWVLITNDAITIDTTTLEFSQFSDKGAKDSLFRQQVVAFGDTFPLDIGSVLPVGAIPIRTLFEITTVWDDSATELDVGSDGSQTYMDEDENDLTDPPPGLFIAENSQSAAIDGTRQVQVREVTAGTPTTGAALVTVQYLLP